MAVRRIVIQLGIWAGCATVGIVLWLALSREKLEFLPAVMRAICAGSAILILSLLLSVLLGKWCSTPSHGQTSDTVAGTLPSTSPEVQEHV